MIEIILMIGLLVLLFYSKQKYQYSVSERDKHLNSVLNSSHPNRMMDAESYLVPGFYTHGYYYDIKDENKKWEDWTYGQKYAKISP